jgi:signal transduction histidine kinase
MLKIAFNKSKMMIGVVIFLVITLMGLMNFISFVTNNLAKGYPGNYQYFFITELTGVYTILLLLPLLIWFFNKFPVKRGNIPTHIPLYLFASIIFGAFHTLLMYLSRSLIYLIANLGRYEYGQIEYRFVMEYSQQFFTFWFIFGFVFLFKSFRERQEQKLKTAQLEQQLTNARLQTLQMQLHPHFLFNSLNMISATMYENVKAADKMMTNLSDLLRITLNEAGRAEHSLEKELELIQLYINIMKARFGNKLIAKMNIDNKTLPALIPGFIMQPLVENAIKYSIETLKRAEIKVLSSKVNNTLTIIIEDNGPGISGNINQIIKNGFGLSNTIERLEKLYGNNQSIHFQNMISGGLKVEMKIPFRSIHKE